jgi:hypothetical protein
MREAAEMASATADYFATPLEDNLFEWHFTVRGPESTDFEVRGGKPQNSKYFAAAPRSCMSTYFLHKLSVDTVTGFYYLFIVVVL